MSGKKSTTEFSSCPCGFPAIYERTPNGHHRVSCGCGRSALGLTRKEAVDRYNQSVDRRNKYLEHLRKTPNPRRLTCLCGAKPILEKVPDIFCCSYRVRCMACFERIRDRVFDTPKEANIAWNLHIEWKQELKRKTEGGRDV